MLSGFVELYFGGRITGSAPGNTVGSRFFRGSDGMAPDFGYDDMLPLHCCPR